MVTKSQILKKVLFSCTALAFATYALWSNGVEARTLSNHEKQAIAAKIRKELKDPESARFMWMPLIESAGSEYCGLYNAKNSYGGYAGNKPFMAFVSGIGSSFKVDSVMLPDGDDEAVAFSVVCGEKGYKNMPNNAQ